VVQEASEQARACLENIRLTVELHVRTLPARAPQFVGQDSACDPCPIARIATHVPPWNLQSAAVFQRPARAAISRITPSDLSDPGPLMGREPRGGRTEPSPEYVPTTQATWGVPRCPFGEGERTSVLCARAGAIEVPAFDCKRQ
jgi:hypothetical protein